jgi:hypothetical protein
MQDVTNQVNPSVLLFVRYSCNTTFLSHTIGPADLHPASAPHFNAFQAFLIIFRSVQGSAPYQAVLQM